MKNFQFATPPKILFAEGAVNTLSAHLSSFKAKSILIVTDAGIVAAGLLEIVVAALASSQSSVQVYDKVEVDPSDSTVLAAVTLAKEVAADLVIGFGGGSSMDVAKLVSLLSHASSLKPLENLYGVDQIESDRLPLVMIPTTAGTGSEVTPISIITTGETTKMGVVSPVLIPDLAILDPCLTLGLPPKVTAATGIDAMVHAIEAFTSAHRKNPMSDMLAKEALALLSQHIYDAVHEGSRIEARSGMMLGACLAGQAFANAPVAAVHALAYPLGGRFHISHGLSNALVLPHVLKFNSSHADLLYSQLSPIILGGSPGAGRASTSDLIKHVSGLSRDLGLPDRLNQLDIPKSALTMLAEDAMQQRRLLVNNPKEVHYEDAFEIYSAAY